MLLAMEARLPPLRGDHLMKRAPEHIRKAIAAQLAREARIAESARVARIDRAERQAKREAMEAYLARPAQNMDIVCVQTGKVTRFRLSKHDRAKRRAQDKAMRRKPNRLRGA